MHVSIPIYIYRILHGAKCKLIGFTRILVSRVSAHGHLKFMSQNQGVGVNMEKPFVCIIYMHMNHTIIKNGV